MKAKILAEYDKKAALLHSFTKKCTSIIEELIADAKISTHFVNSRVKTKDSLGNKIDRKEGKYSCLDQITDACGIRVITYLESDVDKVAAIITKEFTIDPDNSIDKRNQESDQFGYKSLHYVASIDTGRIVLAENRKYKGFKFEIQIRSILQHTWAEIEHDLGYKGKLEIPARFRRNFSRLSALLEIADIEFDRLKMDLSAYEISVVDEIKTKPNDVLLDRTSLSSFNKTNLILLRAEDIITRNLNCKLIRNLSYSTELNLTKFFMISTIGQFEGLIADNEKHYLAFVDLYSKNISSKYSEVVKLQESAPILHFLHFLACKKQSIEYLKEYFAFGSIHWDLTSMETLEYLSIFRKSLPKDS